MADGFDPYYTWLGIRPEESAGGGADHYRLLGVQRFEDNPDAIANAMDQRMHFLRTLQVGKRAAQSQALLNEISVAAGCLLDATRKAEYDRQLRAQLAGHLTVPEALPAPLVAASVPVALPPPPPQPLFISRSPDRYRHPSDSPFSSSLVLALVALIGLPLIGLMGLGLARLLTVDQPRPAKDAPSALAHAPRRVTPIVEPVPAVEPNPDTLPTGGIDLLRIGRQDVRIIRGSVRRVDGAIETPVQSSAFAIPVRFPREYRLEADVVRQQGKNSLCFGFLVQGRPLTAVIDGFDSKVSGLASVGGQQIFSPHNPLAKPGALLTNGRPATVRIEVTRAAVDLSVDGKSVSRWKNDPNVPIRSAQGMHWNEAEALCIFTWDASYRFTRLVVVPLKE